MALKPNENGLVPLFMLKAHDGNVAGDTAGFSPRVAQALIDAGAAEPYSKSKHSRPAEERQKSTAALLEENQARLIERSGHFRPAEILHEDAARRAEALQHPDLQERFVPAAAGSGTREQINEAGTLVEGQTAPQDATVTGAQAQAAAAQTATNEPSAGMTTARAGTTGNKPKGGASGSSNEPPVPPS